VSRNDLIFWLQCYACTCCCYRLLLPCRALLERWAGSISQINSRGKCNIFSFNRKTGVKWLHWFKGGGGSSFLGNLYRLDVAESKYDHRNILTPITLKGERFKLNNWVLTNKKRLIIFLNCYREIKKCKYYLFTTYSVKINKYAIRKSFCRLLSLVFFCWCLSYKRLTVISQHVSVTFVDVSFFSSGYIMTEPFAVLPGNKIQVRLQEIEFQQHDAPQGTLWGKQQLHNFYVVFWFLFPKKLLHTFSNAFQASSSRILLISEVGVLKLLFYVLRDENVFFTLVSLMHRNFCLKQMNPSPSSFFTFTNIIINPSCV
jgi:hypothetical protein